MYSIVDRESKRDYSPKMAMVGNGIGHAAGLVARVWWARPITPFLSIEQDIWELFVTCLVIPNMD